MPGVSVIPAVSSTPYTTILAADPFVIVTDVIRATTTATTAVARGNRCIPVSTVEHAHAEAARHAGAVLAGEQGGHAIPGFELGNSPASIDKLRGETVILLSSSGTPVLRQAQAGSDVFIGCLRTAESTSRAAARSGRDVVILPACTRGEFRDEDRLLAGWIVRHLSREGFEPRNQVTTETLATWGDAEPSRMLGSASVTFLRDGGHEDDLDFIMERIDDLDFTIRLRDGELVKDE